MINYKTKYLQAIHTIEKINSQLLKIYEDNKKMIEEYRKEFAIHQGLTYSDLYNLLSRMRDISNKDYVSFGDYTVDVIDGVIFDVNKQGVDTFSVEFEDLTYDPIEERVFGYCTITFRGYGKVEHGLTDSMLDVTVIEFYEAIHNYIIHNKEECDEEESD